MPQRCAIWARVSTDDQDASNQLAELRQWAGRRGLEVVTEYALDGASAWKGEHREQLAQALADARTGQYDVLLVWALDRLSREGVEATLGLLRRFHAAGAPVWSLREPWTETADPAMAELLTSIYAWMARAESARRSERVRAGLERRRAKVSLSAASRERLTGSRGNDPATLRAGNANGPAARQWRHEHNQELPRVPAPGRRQAHLPPRRHAPRRASRRLRAHVGPEPARPAHPHGRRALPRL